MIKAYLSILMAGLCSFFILGEEVGKTEAPASTEQPKAESPGKAVDPKPAEKELPAPPKPAQETGAKKFKFSGFSRHRYYRDIVRDTPDEHADELRNDLRLVGEFDPKSTLKLLLSVDGRLDGVRNDSEGFTLEESRFRLWEAYVKASMGPVDLRVGRQVIRWGKSDELNPIDNFTPEDFSEFINFDRADRKLPAWMVRADFQINKELNYESVWQPFFEPDVLPPKDSDWYFPGLATFRSFGFLVDKNGAKRKDSKDKDVQEALGFTLAQDEPRRTLHNSVFANRILYSGPHFDMGISYAYHFNQIPAPHLRPPRLLVFAPPVVLVRPPLVEFGYHRQNSFGLDFETTAKGIGFRGEAVYTTSDRFATTSPFDADRIVDRNSTTFVVGADYTFKNDVYVNVQYSGKYIFDYSSDLWPARRYEDSVIGNISRKFLRDDLKLSLNVRYSFKKPVGYYIAPELQYRLSDHARLRFYVNLFGGDKQSTFGQFEDNDQVGVEVKFNF